MHSYYLHQTGTVLSHFAWSRSLTCKRYSHCYIAAYLWCAKHCGIVGNKRADCFANSCRFMPFLIFFIAFLALGDAIFISSAKTSELMFSRDRVSHRNRNIQFRRLFFFLSLNLVGAVLNGAIFHNISILSQLANILQQRFILLLGISQNIFITDDNYNDNASLYVWSVVERNI